MDERVPKSKSSQLKRPEEIFAGLDAGQIGELLLASCEVSLVIGVDGRIHDVGYATEGLFEELTGDWTGQRLQDLVTVESTPKIEMLFLDANDPAEVIWRQVNHKTLQYGDVPVVYASFSFEHTDFILVLGRDMRRVANEQRRVMNFQLSMERAYTKLQMRELRYRKIYQNVSDAVLVVDCSTMRVIEANDAAIRIFGMSAEKLENRKLKELLGSAGIETTEAFMQAALGGRTLHDIDVISHEGQKVTVGCLLLREDKQPIMILKLTPVLTDDHALALPENQLALKTLKRTSDGFVLTRENGDIVWTNESFAEFVDIINVDSLRERPFSQWFDRTGVDFSVLVGNLTEHGKVRRFSTVMRGGSGITENVELSATEVSTPNGVFYGFIVRPVNTAERRTPAQDGLLPYSAEQLASLVGHMSLKDVVRETSIVIERLCIEAALDLTNNNRASAAQLLGLSRQSLYDKMAKTGLDS